MSEVMLNENVSTEIPPPIKEDKPILWRGKPLNDRVVRRPMKSFLYGLTGSGKTTFACQALNPFLLSADGNGEHIGKMPAELRRMVELSELLVTKKVLHKERAKTINDVIENLEELLVADHPFKSVILDTIDSILDFCLDEVRDGLSEEDVRKLSKYGSDYKQCVPYMIKIRDLLDDLWEKRKMNIIILGQAKVKVVQNPLVPAYDRWEPAVNEAIARIFMEWVTCIFYAHKDVSFKKDEDADKATTAKVKKNRLMPYNKEDMDHYLYTSGNAAYCAKNTFNLPPVIRVSAETGWKTVTDLITNNFNNQNQG